MHADRGIQAKRCALHEENLVTWTREGRESERRTPDGVVELGRMQASVTAAPPPHIAIARSIRPPALPGSTPKLLTGSDLDSSRHDSVPRPRVPNRKTLCESPPENRRHFWPLNREDASKCNEGQRFSVFTDAGLGGARGKEALVPGR